MDQINVRNVGPKQVYDSYMGILRISPSELEGEMVDSMTLAFTNPWKSAGNQRQIILSDSDGTQVGLYFTAYIRKADVVDEHNMPTKANVVNVCSNVESNIFVNQTYNVRSTLLVNKEKQQDRVTPIQIYHESPYYLETWDVLTYPIDSPNDDSYFNAANKLGLIDYNKSTPVKDQLKDALYNRDKAWYDKNIGAEHRVKVAGKFIYTTNFKYEQVPVVYTKERVLGHYNGHTVRITDELKTKFIGTPIGQEKTVNSQSVFTRLSFIPLDDTIWRTVTEALQGYTRHTDGRFTQLGVGMNQSISERLFGTLNPPSTTCPLLGLDMPPGLIMYTAMPFRRWMFHALRQQVRNATDENNGLKSLPSEVKAAVDRGAITAINKLDPGFANTLSKEFVLCNGYEVNYTNYPYMNTDNETFFQHDDIGNVIRDSNGKPKENTTFKGTFNAIKNSNVNKKIISPSLLVTEMQSPRYLRGLNWITDMGVDTPIDFAAVGVEEGTYRDNNYKFEVVQDSDYGLTEKNFSNPGNYRFSLDWKTNQLHHQHTCFAETETPNRTNTAGNMIDGMLEHPTILVEYVTRKHKRHLFGTTKEVQRKIVTSRTPYEPQDEEAKFGWVTYGDKINQTSPQIEKTFDYDANCGGERPWHRDHYINLSEPSTWSAEKGEQQRNADLLADYSFKKQINNAPNSWKNHMPIPNAGLWAWKLDDKGNMSSFQEDKLDGTYVIANEDQTPISKDKNIRKQQLETMNYAEGAYPIATKGGADLKLTTHEGTCKSRGHGHLGRMYHASMYCDPHTGGYELQNYNSSMKSDVPRCLTSLPVSDIWNKIKERKPDVTGQMGDTNVTFDSSLSAPPTMILLPLFKI